MYLRGNHSSDPLLQPPPFVRLDDTHIYFHLKGECAGIFLRVVSVVVVRCLHWALCVFVCALIYAIGNEQCFYDQ